MRVLKVLLAYLALFVLLSVPTAWALTESAIEFCLTTANPKQCLVEMQREVAAAQPPMAGPTWDQQAQLQRDLARQQAAGFAAFGSGRALIQGMNQGVRQMESHPYVLPPVQHIPTR